MSDGDESIPNLALLSAAAQMVSARHLFVLPNGPAIGCLNPFSCGIANKLSYELFVDHVNGLDSAMVTSSLVSSCRITLHSRRASGHVG